MRLGELHTAISKEIKRGNSLDSIIPVKVRQAVQWLERNHKMKYMETWVTLDLSVGEQLVDMPWNFRSIKFLRAPPQGNYPMDGYVYLTARNVEEEEFLAQPGWSQFAVTGYSQIGNQGLRFNFPAPGPVHLEGIFYKFSDWQTTRDDFRHFLLDVASDLLMAQAMIHISIYMKDQRMAAAYKTQRDEALKTFYVMDQDVQEDGKDGQMVYTGF